MQNSRPTIILPPQLPLETTLSTANAFLQKDSLWFMQYSPDGDEILPSCAFTARPERLLNFECGKYIVVSSGQGGGHVCLILKPRF